MTINIIGLLAWLQHRYVISDEAAWNIYKSQHAIISALISCHTHRYKKVQIISSDVLGYTRLGDVRFPWCACAVRL